MWQNDVFATDASVAAAFGHHQTAVVGGGSSIETGTKLYISNLDYGVSNEDIKVCALEVYYSSSLTYEKNCGFVSDLEMVLLVGAFL